VGVGSEHDHGPRPPPPRIEWTPADTACWGRCHAPIKSRRKIPDRRRATQRKVVSPTADSPHSESARRRSRSLHLASDDTGTPIQTASLPGALEATGLRVLQCATDENQGCDRRARSTATPPTTAAFTPRPPSTSASFSQQPPWKGAATASLLRLSRGSSPACDSVRWSGASRGAAAVASSRRLGCASPTRQLFGGNYQLRMRELTLMMASARPVLELELLAEAPACQFKAAWRDCYRKGPPMIGGRRRCGGPCPRNEGSECG
jgi:hypothetical protein